MILLVFAQGKVQGTKARQDCVFVAPLDDVVMRGLLLKSALRESMPDVPINMKYPALDRGHFLDFPQLDEYLGSFGKSYHDVIKSLGSRSANVVILEEKYIRPAQTIDVSNMTVTVDPDGYYWEAITPACDIIYQTRTVDKHFFEARVDLKLPRAVVIIRGGAVQDVIVTQKDMDVLVVDYDVDDTEHPDTDIYGDPCQFLHFANLSVSPDLVNEFYDQEVKMQEESIHPNEENVYLMTDQPETCRKCGARVVIVKEYNSPAGLIRQNVLCPDCTFTYILEEDPGFEVVT